ncbi:hypothetical protein Bbelb_149170 [Branchiostoma belcheri]|nr:hypothetical protein Bbelb_149170 [Branchiostoma belcheri]
MATTSFGETFLVANETAAGGGTTEEVPTWLTCLEATFMIVIFMSSVIANLIVFALFYKKPSLLSISNRFVLNLAVSNFLMSLLVTPSVLVSAMARSWIFGDALCQHVGSRAEELACWRPWKQSGTPDYQAPKGMSELDRQTVPCNAEVLSLGRRAVVRVRGRACSGQGRGDSAARARLNERR